MKKISKIIVCIMSMVVIVFLLPLSAIAGYSSWPQTNQEDFDAGIKTGIKTTADGTFKLEDGNWLETTTADFNTGIIKDNINTASDEIKLLTIVNDPTNLSLSGTVIWGAVNEGNYCSDPGNIKDGNRNSYAVPGGGYFQGGWVGINLGTMKYIRHIWFKGGAWRFINPGSVYGKLQYYDGSWHDIAGTQHLYDSSGGSDIKIDDIDVSFDASQIRWYVWGWSGEGQIRAYELEIYRKNWTTGNFRSQVKDLVRNMAFGKFYENHLAGQTYTFQVRKSLDNVTWSDWITVNNGTNIGDYLSAGSKIQYDIILTSNDGITNPKVYDVKIEYTKADGNLISQPHDCGTQITRWANFVAKHTLNGQTIEYAVRTSSYIAGLSDATWYPVVSGGLITAPVNRYVQWKATLSTTDGTKTPVVDDVTLYWDPYPDEPTLTAPENNVWTTNNRPLFEWDFNDDCPGATQAGFRIVIDDMDTFSGINYDSSIQISTTTKWQFPEGTGYTKLLDDIWYWKCCTKNNYSLWGDTSTYRILKVDTTPPDVPIMKTEPEVTAGDQNEVFWYPAGDGDGRGGVEYYVECSSDSGFAWVTKHSDGWITKESWNFTGLSDGVTYYYRVRAQDALGNKSNYSAAVRSRQVKPLITDCDALPDPFSPNADGTEDETRIYYTLSSSCTVTIEVYDTKDNLKKRLVDGKSRPVGANSEIWDGKDEDENIVPNGTYTYKITAVDGMGNRGEKQGTVTVENLVSIVSTIPKDNGYLVIWPGKEEKINMVFNRHMSTTTMIPQNISIIDEDNTPLSLSRGDIVCVSSVTTITPSKLEYCTTYTVEVSKGVTDYLEIPLTEATSFSFTTLIPGNEANQVTVKHKEDIVKVENPSETFPGGSKGYYINLVEKDISSLSKYIEGTGRRLICYGVDYSDNPEDIDWLEKPVTISIPYPPETKDRKNLKLYFHNKSIDRWELVKGSGDTNPDDNSVTGEVRITNTEYCVRGFAMGGLIEEYSNYPNPFKAGKQETTIRYNLEEDAKVTISIYDLLGQLVRRIEMPKGTPERGEAGTNTVPWNGKNERGRVVANGGYYCVLEGDTETGKHMKKVRKIMVIK